MCSVSRFRLQSSAFIRQGEENPIAPKKAVFLSVEGDETERTYFEHLRHNLPKRNATSIVHIEVLRRKRGTGLSSPDQVIELLHEYVSLRNGALLPEELPASFLETYTLQDIENFLDSTSTMPKAKRNSINSALLNIGIHLHYRKYLQTFTHKGDHFAVVIDRDSKSHSKDAMTQCIKTCMDNGYACYVTNPCFEFWLLLHLCDVKTQYANELESFLVNEKSSASHTFTSAKLSKLVHHGKTISRESFESNYLANIPTALKHINQFATSLNEVLDGLGSNLPDLFQILGYDNNEKK